VVVEQSYMDAAFDAYDVDSDGTISLEEFAVCSALMLAAYCDAYCDTYCAAF
jgi:hypothetical protein